MRVKKFHTFQIIFLLGDEEENLYLVQLKHKNCDETEEIFLLITENYIKEKDPLNGNVKFKWPTKILKRCEFQNPQSILLEYDTMRRNLKTREYILNNNDAQVS